jgi:hypothetical protein
MSSKRDFIETERTPGWQHYKELVEEAIKREEVDLSTLETEGKSADDIGLAHVRIAERIAGLKRALGVAEDIKKEPADDL